MNAVPDIYYFDSNVMLFAPFGGEAQQNLINGQNMQETRETKLSSLERIVDLGSDIYEIVPVDPLAGETRQENPYSYVPDGHLVNEGLAVLETLYNHPANDVPEYIDISQLTVQEQHKQSFPIIDVTQDKGGDDDDDDDVIFVKEYKPEETVVTRKEVLALKKEGDSGPRRNPHRKARKDSKFLTRELLYDEDYTVLESSSDEDLLKETLKKSARTTSISTVKELKKWPVNGLHERPEYNDSTKQLEKFDYTIRQIKNSVPVKKVPAKITKKPTKKRKYVTRRKNVAKRDVPQKVPLIELEDIVKNTLESVKQYVENVKKSNEVFAKSKTKCKPSTSNQGDKENEVVTENAERDIESTGKIESHESLPGRNKNILESLEILKNQSILYQVVSGSSHEEILKCLDKF